MSDKVLEVMENKGKDSGSKDLDQNLNKNMTQNQNREGLSGNYQKNFKVDKNGMKERLLRINNQEITLSYKDEIGSLVESKEPVSTDADISYSYGANAEMVVTEDYKFDKWDIEIEPGISIHLPETGGAVTQRKEAGGDSVVFFAPSGSMKLDLPNAKVVEKNKFDLAMLHLISIGHTQNGELTSSEFEMSAYLRDAVKLDTADGSRVELDQGEYTKRGQQEKGVLKFGEVKFSEENQEYTQMFKRTDAEWDAKEGEFDFYRTVGIGETDLRMKNPTYKKDILEDIVVESESAEMGVDGYVTSMKGVEYKKDTGASFQYGMVKTKMNYGMDFSKQNKYTGKVEDFAEFEIGKNKYTKDGFIKKVENEHSVSSREITEIDENNEQRDSIVFDREIFTQDGFAKLDDVKFNIKKEKGNDIEFYGEGNVEFISIPYEITMKNGKVKKGEAYGKEKVEGVNFTVDNKGNLSGEFKDDAEGVLNLLGFAEKSNDNESLIATITLGNLSIENGYLKAGSIHMERGLNIGQEANEEGDPLGMKEEHANIFNCSITGTVATESEKAEIGYSGITAKMAKTTLGTVGVEDFMGFLSGSINYPQGAIDVSASKSAETPKDSFFGLKGNTSFELEFPTGVPLLDVKLKLEPSASIGGTVGFHAEKGKSFDDEWEDGDELKIGGSLRTEGEVGIGAGVGLAFGTILANIDLMLMGKLALGVGGEVKGETGFKYNKAKRKLEHNKNFEFTGSLGGKLESSLNLESNVRFLFWNFHVFSFPLLKKELGSLSFNGTGSKDFKKKGLTEGWDLSGDFTGEWFSKKIQKKFENKARSKSGYTKEQLKDFLDERYANADEAWATLCQLKKMQEAGTTNTAVVIEKDKKESLEAQIETISAEAEKQFKEILVLMQENWRLLLDDEINLKKEVELKEKEITQLEEKESLSDRMREKAEWGGLNLKAGQYVKHVLANEEREEEFHGTLDPDLKNMRDTEKDKVAQKKQFRDNAYKKYENCQNTDSEKEAYKDYMKAQKEYDKCIEHLTKVTKQVVEEQKSRIEERNKVAAKVRKEQLEKVEMRNNEIAKMTMVDLLIANLLGEVSDQNLGRIRAEYNNGKEENAFDKLSQKEQEKIYREKTTFLNIDEMYFDDQTSFYSVLNEKLLYEKDRVKMIRHQRNKKEEIYMVDHVEEANAADSEIYRPDNDDENWGIVHFARNVDHFPDVFKSMVVEMTQKNPDVTMKEFLNLVLSNKKPDGKSLKASAAEKWKLLNTAFGIKGIRPKATNGMFSIKQGSGITSENEIIKAGLAKTTSKDVVNIISGLSDKNVSLDALIKKGRGVSNAFDRMKELGQELEAVKQEKAELDQRLKDVEECMNALATKGQNYGVKLRSLRRNSKRAFVDKNFDLNAAKTTVDIYKDDYVGKIKDNKEIKEDEKIRKGLALAKMDPDNLKKTSSKMARIVKGTNRN